MKIHQLTLTPGRDAFRLFSIFKDQPHVFFLDSSLRGAGARFSYIGFDPLTTVRGGDLKAFKKILDRYKVGRSTLSFPAGAVGYLGYDGSLFFGLYDTILCIDHRRGNLIISGFSKTKIKNIAKKINESVDVLPEHQSLRRGIQFKSNFTKAGYIAAVNKALKHIRAGDIYQINLSHQLKVDLARWQQYASPAAIYRHLRQTFPSEFGAYIDDGKQIVLSASPERFLKLEGSTVQVKPMKGTRPRGRTPVQDRRLKEQLKKDPKEIAELLMVTDLERNDLGRVCDYRSVKVTSMRTIETYASVFQATSTIEGRLRRDCDQFDLLQATFPSGSVTGCPKIEAMKIIEKLEHGSRGLYTGALGYMSFTGDMDFNVMIRTMFLKRDQITFHVGGGIVADSNPGREWQETWDKAKPLIETLKRTFQ